MAQFTVRALHRNGSSHNNIYDCKLPAFADIEKYQSKAVFHSSEYEKIFGAKCKNLNQSKRRSTIVKISSFNSNIQKYETIYREYNAIGTNGIGLSMVGLTSKSLQELGIDEKLLQKDCKVEVRPGSWWCFYWNHSDSAIRGPWRFAVYVFVISIFVSLLSLVVTILK